jgi:LCP family protein required for cell wall assembly
MPTLFKSGQIDSNDSFSNKLLDKSDTNSEELIDVVPNGGYQNDNITKKKPRKRTNIGKAISLFIILISVIIVGGGMYLGYSVLALENSTGIGSDKNLFEQLTSSLSDALNMNQRQPLKGEAEGRTNVLLIGKDAIGAGITDTIMIASYYHKEKKVVTLNIPRDFYVFDGFGSYKINSVYPFAESRQPGSGEQFLADFLSKEFEIPIHYWVSINFDGLIAIVDTLGGIEVNVEREFTDCEYPTRNYSGYIRPCPTFKAGLQKMDGQTALIYARSRKGSNGEGSDFARNRRQSIVIQSIAKEAKRQNISVNAAKINTYLEIVGKNFRTNARIDEMLSGSGLRDDFDPLNGFLRIVWDTSNGILCVGDSADGAYIINYCGGAVAGRNTVSRTRSEARAVVSDMLVRAELSELFDSNVVFLGNLSNETTKAFNSFVNAGFRNSTINNNYRIIKPATSTSVETVTVYINDDNLRSKFESMAKKPIGNYKVEKNIPADRVVPQNQSEAKIVVWVASENAVTQN